MPASTKLDFQLLILHSSVSYDPSEFLLSMLKTVMPLNNFVEPVMDE